MTQLNLTGVNMHFNNWFLNVNTDHTYFVVAFTKISYMMLNSFDAARLLLDRFGMSHN